MSARRPPRRGGLPGTRRGLLQGAAGLAAAGLVTGCGDGAAEPAGEVPNLERDVAVLAPLLDQERASVVAYGRIVDVLSGATARRAARFRSQEIEHAVRLEGTIARLGSAPRPARPAREYEAELPKVDGRDNALALALDVEATSIAAYLDATAKLSTADLRAEACAIVTVEAEQLAALRAELGVSPVPEPFPGGRPLPI